MPKRYAQLIKHVNKFIIFRYFRSTIMDIARNRTKNHAHSMLPIGTWLSSSMSTFYGHRGVLNTGSTHRHIEWTECCDRQTRARYRKRGTTWEYYFVSLLAEPS